MTNENTRKNPSLSTYALLGSIAQEHYKKQGIDLNAMMQECMDRAKDIKDPMERINAGFDNYKIEFLKVHPLFFRCNYILNVVSAAKAKIGDDFEKDIDWEKVNNILFGNYIPYDFNLVSSVSSLMDIVSLRERIVESEILDMAWYKQTCKICGEEFYLSKGELNFYFKNALNTPKRCKNCIKESKGQESVRQRVNKEKKEMEKIQKNKELHEKLYPNDGKTEMQRAFEKAQKEKENK